MNLRHIQLPSCCRRRRRRRRKLQLLQEIGKLCFGILGLRWFDTRWCPKPLSVNGVAYIIHARNAAGWFVYECCLHYTGVWYNTHVALCWHSLLSPPGVRLPPNCCTGDDSRARPPPRLQMKQCKLSVTSNINNQAHKHDIARGQAASIIVNYAPPLLTSIA